MIKKSNFFSILCLLFFVYGCADSEITAEDQIRQYIESGKLAAENRDHDDLSDLIHDQYHDQKNFNKNRLIKMLRAYFFTHKNIHLFIKIDEIILQEKNKAFVTMYVAMAGNVILDTSALTSLRAQIYKFDLQLVKNEKWLLEQAQWQRSAIKNML